MLHHSGSSTEEVAFDTHLAIYLQITENVCAFPGNTTPICYKGIICVYNFVSVPDNCLPVRNGGELMGSA